MFDGVANRSPTRLELMRIVSNVYDRNDLAYGERSSTHNLAHVSPIEKIILLLLSGGTIISVF